MRRTRRGRRRARSGDSVRIVPSSSTAVGNDVVRGAGVDPGDRDHRRLGDRRAAGDHAWSAVTISQATGTGSSASCGIEAWPPLPSTRSRACRPPPSSGPARLASSPCGSVGHDVQREGGVGQRIASSPSSSMKRAPWKPFLARLEHEAHLAGELARRAQSIRAAPASIAVWVSWPQACIVPGDRRGEGEPGLLGHRQRVHVAAQQHGAAGPGPSSRATKPLLAWLSRCLERQPGECRLELVAVAGQSRPSSGSAWIARRSRVSSSASPSAAARQPASGQSARGWSSVMGAA